jgi:hypothetical protein
MQEVLSKQPDVSELEDGTQWIELRLADIGPNDRPAFWVTETHARWDAGSAKIVWADPLLQPFDSLDEAKSWYQTRREALAGQGFLYSDMDW